MQLLRDVTEGTRPRELTPEETDILVGMFRDLYKPLENVIEIPDERLFFIGDLHGDIGSAKKAQEYLEKYKDYTMVFLGDYVDRGPAQIQTMNLVMALALRFPKRVLLLRGNHESKDTCSYYGFYSEVSRNFAGDVFKMYMKAFEVIPLAAMSKQGIFACHGGVPRGVNNLSQIQNIDRFSPTFDNQIALEMVWNDPKEAEFEFAPSIRGGGIRFFGSIAFEKFVEDLGIKIFFRAHEVFPNGVQSFFDGRLYSVFSTSYGGRVDPKIIRYDTDSKLDFIPV
jgi:protein phosphatase